MITTKPGQPGPTRDDIVEASRCLVRAVAEYLSRSEPSEARRTELIAAWADAQEHLRRAGLWP